MRTNPRHTFSLFSIVSMFMTLSFSSCSESQCVKDYSSTVRYNEPISIQLVDALRFDEALCRDTVFVKKNLTVTPSFDFDLSVSPDGSILFLQPHQALEYGEEYILKGRFAALAGSKGSVEVLSITVLKPQVVPMWGPLVRDDTGLAAGQHGFTVTATISGPDPLDGKYLEENTSSPDANGKPEWTHSENGQMHTVRFGPFLSCEKSHVATVHMNYEKYGAKKEYKFTIPELRHFGVLNVSVVPDPYRFDLSFSDSLKAGQDFEALVSMPGAGVLSFSADGSVLKVTPSVKASGTQAIHISSLIQNTASAHMEQSFDGVYDVPSDKPVIRFISSGTILPSASGTKLWFESSGYRKVRVRCRQIYENNILQFLQSNSLSDPDGYMSQVSRCILDTVIVLGSDDSRLASSKVYGLDLSEMVKAQKGAIYNVVIGGKDPIGGKEDDDDYYDSDYWLGRWSSFKDRARNILVSDIGVIVKGTTFGEYSFFVTDLLSVAPEIGAEVMVYNDVNQLIASGRTNMYGAFSCNVAPDKPRTAVISAGGDKAYITLGEGESLSLSNFDVAGNASKDGCKAFIFGERGVWRPGDDIHLCFMVVPDKGAVPAGHPASIALFNPQGQMTFSATSNEVHDGIYAFTLNTAPDAPTGKWDAAITFGAQTWHKAVRIETVKPNNIIIDLKFGRKVPCASDLSGHIQATTLVGLPAAGLKTRMEAQISDGPTSFSRYPGYTFKDQARGFESQTVEFFNGTTAADGSLDFGGKIDVSGTPGMLNASVTTRIFERSGDFSTSVSSCNISPYKRYVGLKVPEEKNEWGEDYLNIDKSHVLKLAAVDADGNDCKNDVNVDVQVYKMGWNWWWTSSSERLAQYARDNFVTPYRQMSVLLKEGKGTASLRFGHGDSGYFFIRVSDPEGGHAASCVAMVCGSSEGEALQNSNSAACLSITPDKKTYNAGQKARLTIPSATGAVAYVSVEKGGTVLKNFQMPCNGTSTVIEIPVTADMAPNVYVSVTLLQPYNTMSNDAPMRLFGVQRINVEDASTHLVPVVCVPGEVRPEGRMSVKVREKDGRPMSFTLAVVDEGLLNLTSFKTPDPWKHFFATEALGVRTWDMYNYVIGAYGARMEQIFAIGGDAEGDGTVNPETKVQRFPPLAVFKGPFTLKKGEETAVDIDLPLYIGNVRVMAVASDGHNMGNASANVKVTKPVVVKMTLPRLVGTDDEISVPVTVIATKNSIGNVKVSLSSEGSLAVSGEKSAVVRMDKEGEQTLFFRMKASSEAGAAKVKAVCTGAGESSSDVVELAVREANTLLTTMQDCFIEAGASQTLDFVLAGRPGSNKVKVEASAMPAIDLDYRLKYLVNYPHGCLEQTVSSAFPQLCLSKVMELSVQQKQSCSANVSKALAALPSFAIPSGGFTTWPNTSDRAGVNIWASIYATHFVLEAARAGYSIPAGLQKKMLSFAASVSSGQRGAEVESRCYACYVLALAGKADKSAMSRIRENAMNLAEDEALMLACAYSASGNSSVARDILSRLGSSKVGIYDCYGATYPSRERNLALCAMLSASLGDKSAAFSHISELAARLSDRKVYMSTQATSWALLAVSDYMAKYKTGSGATSLSVSTGKYSTVLSGNSTIISADIPVGNEASMPVTLHNNGKEPVYVVLTSEGIASRGREVKTMNGLNMWVDYVLPNGTQVDPTSLTRGTDFVCRVGITNNSTVNYKDLALTQLFPCGWEIRPDRKDDGKLYQDWRDDRVYSYFDLPKGSTVRLNVRLTAAYAGKYYHPAFKAEAMYNGSVNATVPGFEVEVK